MPLPTTPTAAILPLKTASTIVLFGALASGLPWLPLPKRFAGLGPAAFVSAFTLPLPKPATSAPAPAVVPTAAGPAVALPEKPNATATPKLSNLTVPPGSLDTFFAALRRAEAGEPGAVARILHYGDSPTTADSITSDLRRLLQRRFGDAGHGFLLIAKPWAWYSHEGVSLEGGGWNVEAASRNRAVDGFHGLGGVSFLGGPGAFSRVELAGAPHTHATVHYLAWPGGGSFTVASGADRLAVVDTVDPEKKLGFAEFALPAGTAKGIELRVTAGEVRLFGYRFDKDGPGVEYSSLGINGAQVEMLLRRFEKGQWSAALSHEDPDLVVLNYGTNESIFPEYIEKQYPADLRTAIERVRAAVPRASVLVMSPMDRGVMDGGDIATPPALLKLIDVQRHVSQETGCAFFDTFEAMGGVGTMGRWYRAEPRLVSADFMHPLPQGAAKVGRLLYDALMAAYEARVP